MPVKDPERGNVVCNALGEGFWGFGAGLAASLTVLPLLIEGLGGGKREVGLISTIAAACTLFPQALALVILQRGVGRKRFLIVYHLAVMTPLWAAIGLAAWFAAPANPRLARVLVHVFFGSYMLSLGFIVPVWVDWVAGLFREKVRGRAFGWSNAAAAGGSALAAMLAGAIAAVLPFPRGYAVLFFIGAAFYVLSMVVFVWIREPAVTAPHVRLPVRELFARFGHSLADRNFRSYMVSRLLLTAGGGPIGFLAVHYKSAEGGALADHTVIALGAALTLSQMVTGLTLGRLGDAFGHKLGALAGAVAQVAALITAVTVPGAWACGAVFALVGVGMASAGVSHQNLLFETCPHDSRMAHITVSNLVLAPLTAAVPLVTGEAVLRFGTAPTFALCLVPTLLGVIWLLAMVKEPRTIPV